LPHRSIPPSTAESYFSRVGRFQIRQIHRANPKYLDDYAHEEAYQQGSRCWSNGNIFPDIVGKCARAMVSRDCCEGNHQLGKSLVV
jgi:hypothetical protein